MRTWRSALRMSEPEARGPEEYDYGACSTAWQAAGSFGR